MQCVVLSVPFRPMSGGTAFPVQFYERQRRSAPGRLFSGRRQACAVLLPVIRRIAGPGVQVIDPAPAVARQLLHILHERGIAEADPAPGVELLSSGDPASLRALAATL